MKFPLVSVILSTYNGEKYLRKQIDSILEQSYPNIELIIGDDCSSDKTRQIIEEYRKFPNVRIVFNEKNVGFLKNFYNLALKSNGKFVAFADQDDIWFHKKIQILIENIEDFSLICSDALLIDEDGKIIHQSYNSFAKKYFISGKPRIYLFFYNFVTGCTMLVKKELIENSVPIPEMEFYHDWWLAIVAAKYSGIKALDIPLLKYRQHRTNLSNALMFMSPEIRIKGLFLNPLANFKIFKSQNKKFFLLQVKRLKGLYSSNLFNSLEKNDIREAFSFYFDKLTSKIHIKSLKIAIKYRNQIYANHSFLVKWLTIMVQMIN